MTPDPLPLPQNWDPQAHLPCRRTEYGVFHESRAGAGLAAALVANGTPEDIRLAEDVLEATLACQERRPDARHRGNFYWMAEDTVVEDLNAVEFVLGSLIPMMIRHGDRLREPLRGRVLESIRLGLEEIRRLDVLVAYTNICVMDVANSCLGGELLGERSIAERGYRKLAEWMAFTDLSGTTYEYNSPTYTAVTIRVLGRLAELVRHAPTRTRARTALARLGLTAALHIHPATGRWAGPHSRAYHPSVVCETAPEVEMVEGWLADGTLPVWMEGALRRRPTPATVEETADAERGSGITTYHGESFALGVASSEFGGQSDVCIAHYLRRGAECPGVLYTRYLTNDKWLGDSYHATDRTRSRNLTEEGQFFGVQRGPRAIGCYTPRAPGACHSAKATLIWTGRERVDEVWVGERRIEDLPADVGPGEIVVVGSGDAYAAVRPLEVTDLHREAPRRLVEMRGDLVLELYNYQGPEKRFWELGWPGAFFQGRPIAAFYLELAERGAYPDGRAFARDVARGAVRERMDPPFTYRGEGARIWRCEYARDGEALGLEVDLMAWKLLRRWRDGAQLGWPMLESPVARQASGGHLELAGAELRCGPDAAWLYADPGARRWVAGYHGADPQPLTLTVPEGRVELDGLATGVVVWDGDTVTVEAVQVRGEPRVAGGRLAGG